MNMTATVGRPAVEVHFGENTGEAIRQAEIATAAAAAALAAERALGVTSYAGYPTTPVPTGTGGYAGDAHYVWPTTQVRRGYITSVEVEAGQAGSIFVGVYEKDGDDFDRLDFVEVTVPSAGVHKIAMLLEKPAGSLVGFEADGNCVRYSSGTDPSGGWYAATSVPFVDTTLVTNIPISIRFEIVEVADESDRRPTSIDLPWQNQLIIGMGQSLMEGSRTNTNSAVPVTTAQEYDSVAFPAWPDDPETLYPATVTNSERRTNGELVGAYLRGEWPGLGAAKQFRDALSRDHNISFTTTRSRVVLANNGIGSLRLDQISQGDSAYLSAIAQAEALGTLTGETAGVLAVIFGQGESDSTEYGGTAGYSGYKASFKTFADDIDADLRAATGQTKRVPTIAYQLGSVGREIARAQLDASLESPLIVIACPMYQLGYYDALHIDSAAERHLGGYYGEAAAKWAAGEKFEPLRPIAAQVLGNTVVLTFNKTGLAFDTTLVPAQFQNGFKCGMSDGVTANNPTDTDVINGNQVRLTFASPPDSGATIYYGLGFASSMSPYDGGAGNLRDSAGDTRSIDGFPLHNWCVLFDWVL